MPVLSIKNGTIAGSISPVRVPMIKPDNGVKPIVVSMERPPLIADTEEPLPK